MIISCGEALIDFLPRTDASGAAVFRPFAGGSPFNTAIALGRLGVPAGFLGGLSTDFFGAMLREALETSHVDLGFAPVSDRPTTLAFVRLVDGNACYAFFDEGSAGRMLTEAELPALPATVTALHFASFSLAEEPCGSSFETLLLREHRTRAISLDPNVRPTLIKNRDGYIARIERMAAMADIVKLSEEDLVWFDMLFDDVAERWLGHGAKLVVVTRGASGASARTKHFSLSVPGVAVKVADTVGAGDTFSAATLVKLESLGLLTKPALAGLGEAELDAVLRFAVKAASITVSRPGADPPWAAEIGA